MATRHSRYPVDREELAPKVGRRERPLLTPELAWQLWDELAGTQTIRYRAFYDTLLFTGIRTSEALGLKWADVDFANQQITIRQAISRGKATTPPAVL